MQALQNIEVRHMGLNDLQNFIFLVNTFLYHIFKRNHFLLQITHYLLHTELALNNKFILFNNDILNQTILTDRSLATK